MNGKRVFVAAFRGAIISAAVMAASMRVIEQFRRIKNSRWNLFKSPDKIDVVINRLKNIITDPDKLAQGSLNLCGPAAFFNLWIKRDPKEFADYAYGLYKDAIGSIGSYEVIPDEDLVDQDYNALIDRMKSLGGVCLPADWMIMGALRAEENLWYDFKGTPEETLAAITLPGEIAEWLEATGLYSNIRNECNLIWTKGVDHAKTLNPTSGDIDIIMLINGNMLNPKESEGVLKYFPNHYVVLGSPVVETSAGTIKFSYWTWGRRFYSNEFDKKNFEDNYYGTIIAEI